MHLVSPGSVCLGDGWPLLQHRGTSADSTAFCSQPGRRDVTGPPPHSAHPRPGVRMSAGAASKGGKEVKEKEGKVHLKISLEEK